jgi:hypothetical protein
MSRYVPCKMADELTTIARKSYGKTAVVVKNQTADEKFSLFVENKFVSNQTGASQEEAFRELKMKLETMAMFAELQNAKEKAKDAAETKRMVDEFAAQARRVYGPTAETEFSPLERTFGVLVDGVRVIEEREATVREAFDRAMDRLDDAAYNQVTIEQRTEFHTLASIVYPGAFRAIDSRKFVFSVVRDDTPIVSETGATMLDAYNAVMARLRAVSVKAEEPDVPEAGAAAAFVKFNALPALVTDVFGDDAQAIVHPQQPYVTIESRIGKHTVFAASASATTQEAVSAAHAWLTAMKTSAVFDSTLRTEMDRTDGTSATLSCWQTTEGWSATLHAFGKETMFKERATRAQVRSKVLAHLLCLPSKTVAASEATATPERTTGVSNEATIEATKDRFRVEAMRVGGPTAKLETGATGVGYNVTLTFGDGASRKVMSETRESERRAYEWLLERLHAMPTFVPPEPNDNRVLYLDGSSIVAASWDGTPINLSITNPAPEQKEPTPMTTPAAPSPLTIAQTLEVDAIASAWRLAGSQFVKLAKEPLVAILSRHLGPDDESLRARIAAFLDTELGTALLSGVLSAGLTAMPTPPNSQAASINGQLARELRVRSMAGAADAIADVLAGPLRQVIVLYIGGDPSGPMGLPDGADRIVVPANVAAEVAR